jgi:putative oxidoreductase
MMRRGRTRPRVAMGNNDERMGIIMTIWTLAPDRNEQLTGWALSLLRIVAALLFIEHGTQKYLGFPVPFPMGEIHLASLLGIAGVLELAGGTLLLIGVLARPVALLLSGEMAIAYFMMHAPQNFYPIANGGEAALLFCFAFLLIAAAGPGTFAIENMIKRGSGLRHP